MCAVIALTVPMIGHLAQAQPNRKDADMNDTLSTGSWEGPQAAEYDRMETRLQSQIAQQGYAAQACTGSSGIGGPYNGYPGAVLGGINVQNQVEQKLRRDLHETEDELMLSRTKVDHLSGVAYALQAELDRAKHNLTETMKLYVMARLELCRLTPDVNEYDIRLDAWSPRSAFINELEQWAEDLGITTVKRVKAEFRDPKVLVSRG